MRHWLKAHVLQSAANTGNRSGLTFTANTRHAGDFSQALVSVLVKMDLQTYHDTSMPTEKTKQARH